MAESAGLGDGAARIVHVHRIGAIAGDSQGPLDVVDDPARHGLLAAHVEGIVRANGLNFGGARRQCALDVERVPAHGWPDQQNAVVAARVGKAPAGGIVNHPRTEAGDAVARDDDVMVAGGHIAGVVDEEPVAAAAAGVHGQ